MGSGIFFHPAQFVALVWQPAKSKALVIAIHGLDLLVHFGSCFIGFHRVLELFDPAQFLAVESAP